MELKKYVNEILDIAKANDMPWDVGMDMFVANIQNAGIPNACYYAGANMDYAALKPEWMAMTLDERGDVKIAFDDWFRANMDAVFAQRKDGGRFQCHE